MEQRTGYCEKCDRENIASEGTELATERDGEWYCNKCDSKVEILPEELKNCPFCNGKGSICSNQRSTYWIECGDCGAETSVGHDLAEGVAKWNRRA